jgi:hypothetical protein
VCHTHPPTPSHAHLGEGGHIEHDGLGVQAHLLPRFSSGEDSVLSMFLSITRRHGCAFARAWVHVSYEEEDTCVSNEEEDTCIR